MKIEDTARLAADLRAAYVNSDEAAKEKLSAKLMHRAARHLSEQRTDDLEALSAALGPVVQAADAFGTELPGARWRAVSELAEWFHKFPQQLELNRWLDPDSVKGQILDAIEETPGLTVSELCRSVGKKLPHVSNEVSRLIQSGLLRKVKNGKNRHLYLTDSARRHLRARPKPAHEPLKLVYIVSDSLKAASRTLLPWPKMPDLGESATVVSQYRAIADRLSRGVISQAPNAEQADPAPFVIAIDNLGEKAYRTPLLERMRTLGRKPKLKRDRSSASTSYEYNLQADS